jgi:hypothetical protein
VDEKSLSEPRRNATARVPGDKAVDTSTKDSIEVYEPGEWPELVETDDLLDKYRLVHLISVQVIVCRPCGRAIDISILPAHIKGQRKDVK